MNGEKINEKFLQIRQICKLNGKIMDKLIDNRTLKDASSVIINKLINTEDKK